MTGFGEMGRRSATTTGAKTVVRAAHYTAKQRGIYPAHPGCFHWAGPSHDRPQPTHRGWNH